MENFNLKKFLVENKLTANSRIQESEGYVEVMGPDFDQAIELLQSAWVEWKNGPMTEPEDIPQAKQDILDYLTSLLK
jgi:hypothetical protein